MDTTKIKQIVAEKPFEQVLTVAGWVKTSRDFKHIKFITINDGSCLQSLQIVVEGDVGGTFDFQKVSVGASIAVEGVVKKSQGEKQDVELLAQKVNILGGSPEDYPIQKKNHSMEFLRTKAHLRSRTNTFSAIFRVRSELSFAIHSFFREMGFVYVHTPIITGNDSEGAGEMFQVIKEGDDFFGKKAFLTVSGQLHAETMALGLGNVYTFGPTFRAEKSLTKIHTAEFWMLEPEMAFYDLQDMMVLSEKFIKYVVKHIVASCPDELAFCTQFMEKGLIARIDDVLNKQFSRMTYTEAIDVLSKAKQYFEFPVKWGIDLQTEHEKYLTDVVCKGPVYVTDYPKTIKAFYMRVNDDDKTVAATDLLVPAAGELIGGSQREERYDVLVKRMTELGMPIDHYGWYLDLRKYGSVPCSGFGMGFERLLMFLTGVANIRDCLAYPRTPNNLDY